MVTLPIKMPKNCFECPFTHEDSFGWDFCIFSGKNVFRYINERAENCRLQDNKSHWKVEYNEKSRKATYTCANCGTAYQVMLVSKDEIKDYADKFCRECGKEMTCVVRTIEPKESEEKKTEQCGGTSR